MTSVTSIDNEATEVTNDSTMEDESFTTNDFHPDEREELQRKYLNMIKMCDVLEVQKLLENNSGFDLNCKNYQGITCLNLAIEANCEPMIDLLLSRTGLEIGDSLMRAIRHNYYPIVIKLLDLLQVKSSERTMLGYEHSAEFPQYLTPIMLAAQCGHYQIISLLLESGHTIPIPHKARCLCKEVCKSLVQLNSGLEASELKLSVFRALSNLFYIYLTSEDPILTAFQLSKQLLEHGNVNRLFKSDYESLNLQTRVFAVDLIGLCRSSCEVKLRLTRKEGSERVSGTQQRAADSESGVDRKLVHVAGSMVQYISLGRVVSLAPTSVDSPLEPVRAVLEEQQVLLTTCEQDDQLSGVVRRIPRGSDMGQQPGKGSDRLPR
ncbi:hypothetical protein QTP88_025800 [Uroleucon formosanum]